MYGKMEEKEIAYLVSLPQKLGEFANEFKLWEFIQ